ncbi:ester cyclase [Acidomonas methanolica]|uniref:ester cyclase n=1 Tax=Acidomonas methanolica TaxID=437 RepID=UPI0038CD3082
MQELFADGQNIVMTWLWSGTHTGDLPGFPATDRLISMSGATVYTFDNNERLTGHWQITDRLGVFQQLHRSR